MKNSAKKNVSDAVDAQLERYRSMRDFSVTAEPSGAAEKNENGTKYPFCIQKHAASHLHYDFRLGWNGVLKSWAVAKGPSYSVKDKRLAVQVEDHPIEYGGFEGIIPAGQYGGGTVMLWDQGSWEPQPYSHDVDASLRDGQLKFILHGTKLHGKWALIRMKPRPKETKPTWLLIKEHDEFERPEDAEPVTESEPNSVVTGRSLEQISANQDHVWNSNRPEKQATKASVPHLREAKVGPAAVPNLPGLEALPKEPQPTFLKPQLALETKTPPDTPGWLHELKLDGYRMQARKAGTKVQLFTRSGLDWTARMASLAREIAKLPFDACTLDGEVVVLAADGTTSFADLQASFQESAKHPLTFFCFDLLHLNGHNTRSLPLIQRKELLCDLLKASPSDCLQFTEHLTTSGVKMFHRACELHAEGIVSKRANCPYAGTRNGDWLKSKCLHEQEFVVGGYTLPGKGKAGGPGIGALLLGFYDGAKLIYAGRTGTGFSQKFAAKLRKQLHALETSKSPFAAIDASGRKAARWVEPSLVVQVRFANWTADNQVRQAAFLGLREDKSPQDVHREKAAPTPKEVKPEEKHSVPHLREAKVGGSAETSALEHPPVRLTHPNKILDPASGLTKQQLADFYWAVSERMLPHLAHRPLSLVRVPEGIGKEQFFQKHVSSMLPPGFDTVPVRDKKTGKIEPYIALHTREAIAALAQIAVLEVHPWGSCADALETPDRLVFDLDPDPSLPWKTLAGAAADVRKLLKSLGLESFLKTTGGKGLHVVVPIAPEHEWPAIKDFCHAVVLKLERAHPALYLTKMTKSARAGKIYLDYLRNERGATAVAPWSPRARPHAGVAVPLSWSELKLPERPVFTIGNFDEWKSRLKKDPWAKLPVTHQTIEAESLEKT